MATITKTLEVGLSVKAILRDGELTVSVGASYPYGNDGRIAGHTEILTGDFPKIMAELQKVLDANQERILSLAEAGAAQALSVAARRGEIQ